ncbi:hypothetical protein [Komagataeibacter diospyri]|uniref:hypothetical protein n=1 Tax=Komagataeibacter diospyri TaxID=1932662 RepID=UPI003757F62A
MNTSAGSGLQSQKDSSSIQPIKPRDQTTRALRAIRDANVQLLYIQLSNDLCVGQNQNVTYKIPDMLLYRIHKKGDDVNRCWNNAKLFLHEAYGARERRLRYVACNCCLRKAPELIYLPEIVKLLEKHVILHEY